MLIPGDKAPHLITRNMLAMMQPGTVLVDVAIDQGGCFETSHPTTHSAPTYVIDGIVHYAVANIPGAVPYTSTLALTNATLPYVIALANKGWKKACKDDPALALGLNVVEGKVASVKVNMGHPGLKACEIPIIMDEGKEQDPVILSPIEVRGQTLSLIHI